MPTSGARGPSCRRLAEATASSRSVARCWSSVERPGRRSIASPRPSRRSLCHVELRPATHSGCPRASGLQSAGWPLPRPRLERSADRADPPVHIAAGEAANWPAVPRQPGRRRADDLAYRQVERDGELVWKIDVPGRGCRVADVWGLSRLRHRRRQYQGTESRSNPCLPTRGAQSGGPMSGATSARPPTRTAGSSPDVDFKSGKIRWQTTVHTGVPVESKHQKNAAMRRKRPRPTASACTCTKRNAVCSRWDMNGSPRVVEPMGPFKVLSGWGPARRPSSQGSHLHWSNRQRRSSFIAAYDTRTGAEIWKVNRDEGATDDAVFVGKRRSNRDRTRRARQGAILRSERQAALDIDRDGQRSGPDAARRARPPVHQLGYPGVPLRPVYAIRSGARATSRSSQRGPACVHRLVALDAGRLQSFGARARRLLYTLIDRGLLMCHDAKTGKEGTPRQRITAAPPASRVAVAYNGRIFAMSEGR